MKQSIAVWDELVVIDIYRRSKTVWVATGRYMDKHLNAAASTASAAAKRWQDAATKRGNG